MKPILKAFYSLIPFKKELFSLIKTVWKPKESIYRHLHFKEAFTVKVDDTRAFKIHNGNQIENEIFWEGLTGKFEKESIKLWLQLCEHSNCIVDIGANTGVYALAAKTINTDAKVYAFEPNPVFYEMLKKNVEINHYDVFCYKTAISNYDGTLSIDDFSGNSPSITVESIKLDTFIEQNKIEKIDLLKIDVETHEPQVMEGFLKHLSQFKPTFLIEILNEEVADFVYGIVNKQGYLYFNIDERGSIRRTERIERSDYYNYLLCEEEIARKLGLLKYSK